MTSYTLITCYEEKQNPVIWSKSFSVKMKLESVKMVYNII